MDSGLVVDSDNQLQELKKREIQPQPPVLRVFAEIISYVFHPVFVPVYVTAFMLYVHPYLFAGESGWNKSLILIRAIMMFTFFPLVTVGLLKALNFIDSIKLNTQRDRIIPFVACGIWYFWIWYVSRNLNEYPDAAREFPMSVFLAASAGLMLNIYMKVSLHAISMGVVVAFMLYLSFNQQIAMGVYLSAALLIAGLVCTARFIVSDHTKPEVYIGLLAGMLSQVAGHYFG